MPSRPFLALLVVAAAAAGCGCGSGNKTGAGPVLAEDSAFGGAVREVVEPLYEDEILHGGMVVALIDPSRKTGPVEYLGFGQTSAELTEPPGADAIFEIGSISKVLTSLLLADAVVRGEVGFDTAASQLLPFGVRFPDKDGERVTLVHLASHRSGLPALPDNLAPADLGDPYRGYGADQLYAYLERAELMFTPGTSYAYSNLGAGILGHLLARRIGTGYEDAVRARVLEPLGLKETWIAVPETAQARVVPGRTAGGKPGQRWTFDALAGAGAWLSTPRDMVRLLEVATAAARGKDAPLAEVLRTSFAPLAEVGQGMQVALAWHVTSDGILWHNGMTGGHASFIGLDPSSGRGVVILASTASPLVTRIGIGLFDVFAGKPLDLDLRIVELPDADLDRLVGSYRLGSGEVLTVQRSGKALQIAMGPEEVRLYPRSPVEFIVLELEASVDFVIEDERVRGFVLHLPQGDVLAERIDEGGTPP